MSIKYTNGADSDFIVLCRELDAYLYKKKVVHSKEGVSDDK